LTQNNSLIRKKIVKKILEITKKQNNSEYINTSKFYPCTWYNNLGYYYIQSFYKNNYFKLLTQHIKEFLLISNLYNYKIINGKNTKNKKYDSLIISWFDNEKKKIENYKDQYVGLQKNSLYFLLNVGNNFSDNSKIQKNIISYQKKKSGLSFIYLLKVTFNLILKNKLFDRFFFYKLNWNYHFSNLLSENILKIVNEKKIKKVYIPFEAQPFQKKIILELKKIKNVKIIGYINAIQPLPIHLYDTKYIPDLSYSMSKSQIYQLTKIFKWKKKKIKLIKSNRFNIHNSKKYKSKIVLPYEIYNKKKILEKIDYLFHKKSRFLDRPSIAAHPVGMKNKKYNEFVKKIELIINKYENSFSKNHKNKNYSIVIGSTSTVLECVEYKFKVFHVMQEPPLECLEKYFWPNIDFKIIDDHIFTYSTKKYKNFINY
tara:strand:- start:3746 stop:5029 length:1284 start_codon:yes stop_codon:yes gene_type:complete